MDISDGTIKKERRWGLCLDPVTTFFQNIAQYTEVCWATLGIMNFIDELNDVFDLEQRSQGTDDIPVVRNLVKLCKQHIALTINLPTRIPTFKKMNRQQKIAVLDALWCLCKKEFNCSDDSNYCIENTVQGEPHLHGQLNCQVNAEICNPIYDKEFLRSIGKFILKQLPRSMYKQYASAISVHHMFQCPAICVKFVYSDYWQEYMAKNAGCVQ